MVDQGIEYEAAVLFGIDFQVEHNCPVCGRLAFLGKLGPGSQMAVKCRCCKSIWLAGDGDNQPVLLLEFVIGRKPDGSKIKEAIVHNQKLLHEVGDWKKCRCPKCGGWFNLRGVPTSGTVLQVQCAKSTCKGRIPIIAP